MAAPLISEARGGDQPSEVDVVSDEQIADHTESTRVAENDQPRAGRVLSVDDKR